MSCIACQRFDTAERAAIEGREMPAHTLGRGCTCVFWPSPEEQEAIDRALMRLREMRDGGR